MSIQGPQNVKENIVGRKYNQCYLKFWFNHLSILLGRRNLSIRLEVFLRRISEVGIHHTKPGESITLGLEFLSQKVYSLNNILHGEDHFKLDCVHINKVWVGRLNLEN